MHYDVAIIGAGEAGVFAGYELMKLRPELSVLVLEQACRYLFPPVSRLSPER